MRTISWDRDGGKDNYYITNLTVTASYRYPRHNHRNHWELVYCAAGSLSHGSSAGRRVQGAGELILFRDRDDHALRSRGCRYSNLAFRADWIAGIAGQSGFGGLLTALDRAAAPPSAEIPPEERPALERRFDRIPALRETPAGAAGVTALILDLLVRLLPSREPVVDAPGWLQDTVDWARGCDPVPSLTELTSRCGYTREHMSRTFRECLGIPPGAWLRGLRLERCCALLRHTNYPVIDIVARTGFPDTNYFYRLFRKRFGISPGEYRRRYGKPYILP